MIKTTEWKQYTDKGNTYRIRATYGIDYDFAKRYSQAASFSITGQIEHKVSGLGRWTSRDETGCWNEDSSGCIHEEIAKHFPELAHLIKWHLVSTEGPLHYEANAIWWWEHAEAIRTFQHAYEWEKYGSPREAALAHFKSTIVADAMLVDCRRGGDGKLNYLPREGSHPNTVREWLRARLPALLVAFTADMKTAGVL